MANSKSAEKRVRILRKKTLRNKSVMSELKTTIKKANSALDNAEADKKEAIRVAIKKIDQVAARGLLHKNTAARKKSKLQIRLNKAV